MISYKYYMKLKLGGGVGSGDSRKDQNENVTEIRQVLKWEKEVEAEMS